MLTYFRRARNLQRYHKIVAVLARHGFGSILENLELSRYLPLPPRLLKQRATPPHLTAAEHLRLALEELGPTFIKLGQILSTRPDLFPPQIIDELSKLQDRVPPTPWEEVCDLLREEYGTDLQQIFVHLDAEPLGSASLAQVHAAELPDGRQVVLKIQRPRITHTIQADLDILSDLAHLAQRTSWGQLYNPVEIVANFAFTLQNELDYRREGLNADRFRANFAGQDYLYIPEVYWDYSTPRILVMERLKGVKIDDFQEMESKGIEQKRVAACAADIVVKEIMEDGFFHADPHPGNFVVMQVDSTDAGIVIGAMDFGMVGHISRSDRMNLIQAFALSSRMDSKSIVEHMLRMGAITTQIDLAALERDIDRILNAYRGLPLKHIQSRRVIEEIMQITFHYRVSLPPDIWLLLKTMTMMDGLARQLDPDFNIFSAFEPHVRRILLEMRLPWSWWPALAADFESLAFAAKDLPSIGENILRGLQRGEIPLKFKFGANKETLDRIDRVSTRLSLSLLVAAFIIGLALLLPVASGNTLAMALIVIGFVAALGLGVWLVFSILGAGK